MKISSDLLEPVVGHEFHWFVGCIPAFLPEASCI